MTQHQRIHDYMSKYGSITPMTAFEELGITKLSTRIGEMRRNGFKIGSAMVHGQNRFGDRVDYMRYWLE